MNAMHWSLLALFADEREYTAGEVMASSAAEARHVETIRQALRDLHVWGFIERRGRGLHIYRITPRGKSELRWHAAPVWQ